ncbi:MAG: DUF4097 family beta strand repeat-containing protein [Bacteroidota bacterium]
MKPSLVRLSLFALFTVAFVSGLIAYSNSRGSTLPASEHEEYLNSDSRRFEKQFSVSEGGQLIVDAEAGTINIGSWEKNEVSVVVEVEGSDSRVGKYEVEFTQEGNTISVIGKVKDHSFFKWHIGNLEASYTIKVPKKFKTKVTTSGGNINASDLIGKVDYSTSGGSISVEKIEGETIVSTSGGDIDVRRVIGDVDAETSGGNVMCENIVGNVYGHTSCGNVEVRSVDGRVKVGTSGGSIVIRVSGENKGIEAETSGGDIEVFVKESIQANVDAETSGGSVDCDLPVTVKGKVRDSELRGKINGGGNVIKLETSGGNIHIAKLE